MLFLARWGAAAVSAASWRLEQQGQSHPEKILWPLYLPVLELSLYHSLGNLPEAECTPTISSDEPNLLLTSS